MSLAPERGEKRMQGEEEGGALNGGAAVPSSSLSAGLDQQLHPAADFPKLVQGLPASVAPQQKG